MLAQRFLSVLAFALLLASVACDDPCLSLARDICKCERTQTAQSACIQRIEALSVPPPSSAEEDCCIHLAESCTCEKLGAGDLDACGIAQEADSTGLRECKIDDSLDPADESG